ncbi:MAG: hypothetical protein KDI14_10195 [Halioglobus sp.]|nr:hypothetical protein [Halioglobus sp.]
MNAFIHMNGRIYSPKLGRMLSPDPVTQAPENGQNYNRYTYAYNNPLRYSDPSGFVAFGSGCWTTVTTAGSDGGLGCAAEIGIAVFGNDIGEIQDTHRSSIKIALPLDRRHTCR